MDDLVSRKEVLEALKYWKTIEAYDIIQRLPSRIVHCKDCIYWNTDNCAENVGECQWALYMTSSEDYCSHGGEKEMIIEYIATISESQYNALDEDLKIVVDSNRIIKCNNCINWQNKVNHRGWCDINQVYSAPDDYCSNAERRNK